ncbi:uncharacterized protein LOC124162053 [Ischnura elegans]|uniref:uncharacterized protein LOC124162053 n=1 Tax=Ischnura elegans TaxID=197161 RepID=UPI001ED89785|nr:uncharacterized protein LOC124162053 [Ischnura elegans]
MIYISRPISNSTTVKFSQWLRRPITFVRRTLSNDTNPSKAASDSPVKFSASKAASWNARKSRGDIQRDAPWFEPYVVISSITVFMLYFCVFREENDLDIELNRSLFERIPGLEKKQLEIALSYNESQGLDTADLRNRLKEIEAEELIEVDK